ncbi:hypothetical protein [Mucilaginibacter sp.]
MKLKNYKLSLCLLFTGIFMLKMLALVTPAFISLFSKTESSLVSAMEQESKTDKEDPDKDAFKEKKFFDENCFYYPEYRFVNCITVLEYSIHQHGCLQLYHPTVPTPPPNG